MRKEQLVSDKRGIFQFELDQWVKTEGILDEGESIQVQFVVRKIVETVIPSVAISEQEMAKKLAMKIQELDLCVRTNNLLVSGRLGLKTVADLVRCSEDELRSIRRFGNTSFREIKRKLEELGLSLNGG